MTDSHRYILGMRVDATSYADAIRKIIEWARQGESRYVCVANVHMVMEAHADAEFRKVVNGADLVTPDGMPLVWLLRRVGFNKQQRVYGPTLTLSLCESIEKEKIPVGFYGSSTEALEKLVSNLKDHFPGLKIDYLYSPPFRQLTETEDCRIIDDINASGARVLFVGLGCPKQEGWMADHRGHIHAVTVGVGAAFDFHAGKVKQAPSWLQNIGMEWLFRLLMEPRRLWKRYLVTNSKFIWLLTRSRFLGNRR